MKTLVDLRIVALPPDSPRVADHVRLDQDLVAHDSPWQPPTTEHRLRCLLRDGWDGEAPVAVSALLDDRVVGSGYLWCSNHDNLTSAWLEVSVHPSYRRRGIGSQLLERLCNQAREAGRPLVGMSGWDTGPAHGFARAHGFEARLAEVLRRQVLAQAPWGRIGRVPVVLAQHAPGYELVRVRIPVPEELLPGLADLWGDINDAPTDNLEIEDEVFPVERIRSYERAQTARGDRLYQVLARHRASEEISGHTIVAVDGERPWLGDQHDTTVARAHRGHRLGWLLKAEMLRWLAEAEPQLRQVDTWNAGSNAHMIAVNEELGYRVVARSVDVQRRLA